MNLFEKFRIEYESLSGKEKSNFESMLVDALSVIPIIGSGVNFSHSLTKFNRERVEKIIRKIILVDKPSDLDDFQFAYIAYVLKNVFSNPELVISEYVSLKKEEFIQLVLDKYNECRIMYDHSEEVRNYIVKITEIILNNIDQLETPESVSKTALKGVDYLYSKEIASDEMIAAHDKKLALHDERITTLEKDIEICTLNSDNDIYLDYFKEKLFLEDEDSAITLQTMYVPSRINGENSSAAQYIMSWYKKEKDSCLLIYGEAGIGKTSLISKIIADTYDLTEPSNREFTLSKDEVYAVILREHKDVFKELEDDYSPINILCNLFSSSYARCDRHNLKGKLLILDGLDELMVLVPSFTKQKANEFVQKLTDSKYGLKILITSRPGYFQPDERSHVKIHIASLLWTELEVNAWCDKYVKYKPERKQWCDSFKQQYHVLPKYQDNDRRREILCIPFVIYISCNSNVDLNEENTVGKIYDYAFRNIIMREHSDKNDPLRQNSDDRKMRIIHWQYTKELAYQMHFILDLNLLDDESSDDKHAKAFRKAQDRTIEVLNDKEFQKNHDIDFTFEKKELSTSKYLAVFQFAKSNGEKGVSFVHKSVYEYFTAVKLYEDYFAKFNERYFKEHEKTKESRLQAELELLESCIEAFRYKDISPEVFKYLIDMDRPIFTGNDTNNLLLEDISDEKKFNKDLFLECFDSGLRQNIFSRIGILPAVEHYLTERAIEPNNIYYQLSIALHNLTWYLTGLGYDNSKCSICEVLCMMPNSKQTFNFEKWNFCYAKIEGIKLLRANLIKANFSGAVLTKSDLCLANLTDSFLKGANLDYADLRSALLIRTNLENAILRDVRLNNAILREANLRGADLRIAQMAGAELTSADLTGANLEDADLTGAYLINANLTGANLKGTKFKNAIYSTISGSETKFPEGFEAEKQGMIIDTKL